MAHELHAKYLDGRHCAQTIKNQLKLSILQYPSCKQHPPTLAVIQVGEEPASTLYIDKKKIACHAVGIKTYIHQLPLNTPQDSVQALILKLNAQPDVHGILLQLPLPHHLDTDALIESIALEKDVDGIHPYTLGKLAQKCPTFKPCTAYGIEKLLSAYALSLSGLNTVIVGASNIVGCPCALNCLAAGATITVCHSKTHNLEHHVQQAQCLIVAIGDPTVIQAHWIKPGAIVIDVGINRDQHGKIKGDIPFDEAAKRASFITPVPGGVGPMTVAALLLNTWTAYTQQILTQ